MVQANSGKVLISGAGIAGLTLATLLKERGYEPLVIERDAEVRTEGYMMDFFGTGWDVAERMDLIDELRTIRYPIEQMEFVDTHGAAFNTVSVGRIRDALKGNYVYLRRADLERILFQKAQGTGVSVRFGCTVKSLSENDTGVSVTFQDGGSETFDLVFGADGLHSRIRTLVFGDEQQFSRYLGAYVAAYHLSGHDFPIGHALKLYEETDRVTAFYPLDDERMDATYVFRHPEITVAPKDRLAMVRKHYEGAGWIGEDVLRAYKSSAPIYFDTLTQIVMPEWYRGRVALVGDACGCLTLLAGQGSHMAMAGAYVLAQELARHQGDHLAAFKAYQAFLKPHVESKQKDAARFARVFIPSRRSIPALRRLAIRILFSGPVLGLVFRALGSRSALAGYR